MGTCFRMALFCSALSISVLGSRYATGQRDESNWNRFRGPNGSGILEEASLPTVFGATENLIWKTEIPNGFSSPVIQGNQIFLTGEESEKLLTMCVRRSDGKLLWQKSAPRPRKEKLDGRNHPASPSVAVTRESVVAFFGDFGLVAYDLGGNEKWKHELGPFANLYGMGASPIISDGVVVLVCDQNLDSFVIGIDEKSGKELWKKKREEATSGHCSPILWNDRDKRTQVLVAGSFQLTSYDIETGERLWWVGGLCFEMKSTPVISNDILFINGYGSPQNQPDQEFVIEEFADVVEVNDEDKDGLLSGKEMPDALARNFFPAVDLDSDGKLNEKEWNYFRASIASKNSVTAMKLGGKGDMTKKNTLWKYHKNVPQLPSPILVSRAENAEQLLLIDDRGVVTALDPRNGREQFKGRIPGGNGNYYASPVATSDKIIFATTSGKISVLRPNEKIDVLAVNDLKEKIFATPAIYDNRLFVRTEKALYCFGKK